MQTRGTRSQQAKQTVAILEAGYYTSAGGKRVDIAEAMKGAKRQTVIYSPEKRPVDAPVPPRATEIEVRNKTTFAGLQRSSQGGHIGCLTSPDGEKSWGRFPGRRTGPGRSAGKSLGTLRLPACSSGILPNETRANRWPFTSTWRSIPRSCRFSATTPDSFSTTGAGIRDYGSRAQRWGRCHQRTAQPLACRAGSAPSG